MKTCMKVQSHWKLVPLGYICSCTSQLEFYRYLYLPLGSVYKCHWAPRQKSFWVTAQAPVYTTQAVAQLLHQQLLGKVLPTKYKQHYMPWQHVKTTVTVAWGTVCHYCSVLLDSTHLHCVWQYIPKPRQRPPSLQGQTPPNKSPEHLMPHSQPQPGENNHVTLAGDTLD